MAGFLVYRKRPDLLDFCFLELDMLLGNRVVFPLDHFFGHRAGVLLGDIEEAGVRRGGELDFDCCRLGHGLGSCSRLSGIGFGWPDWLAVNLPQCLKSARKLLIGA